MEHIDTITLKPPEYIDGYGHIIKILNENGMDVILEFPPYISYDISDNNITFKHNHSPNIGHINKLENTVQALIYENQSEWLDCHLTRNDIKSLTVSPIKENDAFFNITCSLTGDILTNILSELRPFSHKISIDHILCKSDSFTIIYKLLSIIREVPEIRFQNKNSHENKEGPCDIEEFDIDIPNDDDAITLSTPIDIYKEMYRKEKIKAKEYRRSAIEAYLKAKDIKMRYITKDIDISDDSDEDP